MRHACFISARPMSKSWCSIRIIRPATSTTRPIQSAPATPRKIKTSCRRWLQSVADAGAVLITGPANAKTELIKHIHQHAPQLMKIIVGVETVDHPSDAQLVAHARHYFKIEDLMLPQKP